MHIMGKLALKICPFEWNRVLMRRELGEDACTCDIEMDLVASPASGPGFKSLTNSLFFPSFYYIIVKPKKKNLSKRERERENTLKFRTH